MDSNDGSVSLSLEDLTGFPQPLGGSGLNGTEDSSYEDGGTSFLSSADLSHDAFDLVADDTSDGYNRRTPSIVGRYPGTLLVSSVRDKCVVKYR